MSYTLPEMMTHADSPVLCLATSCHVYDGAPPAFRAGADGAAAAVGDVCSFDVATAGAGRRVGGRGLHHGRVMCEGGTVVPGARPPLLWTV